MKTLPSPDLFGSKVEVYRNIHHQCLSIRRQSLVIGHAQQVSLKDVQFVVQPGGRKRVLESRHKNVHAFARGVLVGVSNQGAERFDHLPRVSYNPYKAPYFYHMTDESPIYQAEAVLVTIKGIYVLEEV